MKNTHLLPQACGIYKITNLLNNASYIGQSINIYKRFCSHHKVDYNNPNSSCYNIKLYRAFRKYGLENFKVEVLELCQPNELNEKEIAYIEYYDSYHHGYNSTLGGTYFSENIHSKETEQKRQITRELNQSLKSENHPRAKLKNEEVIQIRQRYIDGESVAVIFEDYKHLYNSIDVFKRIIFGYTYKDVGNIPTKAQIRHTNGRLTEKQVKDIREKYATKKYSQQNLADEYKVSSTTIRRIIKREIYKNID